MMRRRAFTLIEVLAALLLFAVIVVAVIEAITLQVRAEQVAEDTTLAVILAQNIMEDIRLQQDHEPREESGEDGLYTWTYRLEGSETAGLSRVAVTVSWPGRDFNLESLLAER